MLSPRFLPYVSHHNYPADEMRQLAQSFCQQMSQRRTVRQFSNRPVSRDIIEQCIKSAATAPSGANLQPWHFVVVTDPSLKRQIRAAAEREEQEFYQHRAPESGWRPSLHLVLMNTSRSWRRHHFSLQYSSRDTESYRMAARLNTTIQQNQSELPRAS